MPSPRSPFTFLSFLSFLSFLPVPSASAGDMIGVTWGGAVVDVDSSTGAGTVIAQAGVGQLNAMAVTSGGVIHASSGLGTSVLVTIDGTTGQATPTGITAPGDVRGLAFDANDLLYAVVDGSPDVLWTIDVGTGQATVVGPTGLVGIQSLGFSNGQLYAWDGGANSSAGGAGLVTLSTATGAHTDVGPAGGTVVPVQFLTADGAGGLYGGRQDLYQVDTNTGTLTLVGPIGVSDLRGCDFRSTSPCPGGWSLYGGSVPGEVGPPALALVGAPKTGTVPALDVDSSSLSTQTALLFFGLAPAQVPGFWGGDLLVQPLASPALPMGPAGFLLPLQIPDDPGLCHLKVYFQLVQTDPFAPLGVSSSRGLELTIGL